MSFRQEIPFPRDRARRPREMTNGHSMALSDQLRVTAAEQEARAEELRQPHDMQRVA
jgi:hypothetical protein